VPEVRSEWGRSPTGRGSSDERNLLGLNIYRRSGFSLPEKKGKVREEKGSRRDAHPKGREKRSSNTWGWGSEERKLLVRKGSFFVLIKRRRRHHHQGKEGGTGGGKVERKMGGGKRRGELGRDAM